MICTFFGHRDAPSYIKGALRQLLIRLIEEEGVTVFYVGNHGAFDAMVRALLKELVVRYPHIRYAVVLAYLPSKADAACEEYADTVYPEEVAARPPRFAIPARNAWMLARADLVITYVQHPGEAAKMQKAAERKGKKVINLFQLSISTPSAD